MGIENACQKCHADRSLDWQTAAVTNWWGELKPRHPMIANLIQAESVRDPSEAATLLLYPDAGHPMARAAGLSLFIQRFLRPDMPAADARTLEALKILATSNDIDLKPMALMALHVCFEQQPGIPEFIKAQSRVAKERALPFRNRWSVAATYFGNGFAQRGQNELAVRCFEKALMIQPENIVALSQLSRAHITLGNATRALATLNRATEITPHNANLHFQRAQIHVHLRQIPEAIQAFETGLTYAPNDPQAQTMLQQLKNNPPPAP